MKRFSVTKAIAKRRRLHRLKKLKQAALTMGIATAWGATADAASLNVAATVTLSLADSAFVLDARGTADTATATITVAGLDSVQPGHSLSITTGLDANDSLAMFGGESGYYYIGVSGNDLVLSFPNGGNGALGEFWDSLFRDSQGSVISEGALLSELENSPLQDGADLDPNSLLGQFNNAYGDLLRTPFGAEAELVAFSELDAQRLNHGQSAGQVTLSLAPEPTTLLIVYSAGGMTWLGVRRRD